MSAHINASPFSLGPVRCRTMAVMAISLDYAPKPSRRAARWWLLWGPMAGVIGAAAAIWIARSKPPALPATMAPARIGRVVPQPRLATAAHVEAEQRCLNYTAPPEQVVYEEDPAKVVNLIGSNDGWVDLSRASDRCGLPAAEYVPACWTTLLTFDKPFDNFPAPAIVFLHARTSPAGVQKLVVAWYDGRVRIPWGAAGGFTLSSIDLRGIAKLPETVGSSLSVSVYGGEAEYLSASPDVARFPLRLFAGQPDPGDASRFTIGYELNGQRGTIEGRLVDAERYVVQLRITDGPAVPRTDQAWSDETILEYHRAQGLREGRTSWGNWRGDSEPPSRK